MERLCWGSLCLIRLGRFRLGRFRYLEFRLGRFRYLERHREVMLGVIMFDACVHACM
jgi:hypothetical protein